jgi:hypothetical protein
MNESSPELVLADVDVSLPLGSTSNLKKGLIE